MDDDVNTMSHDQLVAEVKKLRAAIRVHRDSAGQEPWWLPIASRTDRPYER